MGRTLNIIPSEWACSLIDCPPGFFVYEDALFFKDEYGTDGGGVRAYCESGEYCHIKDETIVQPVIYEWRDG